MYCSQKSSNIDILLEYQGASENTSFTLTHFFIAGDCACDSSIREGLVWFYGDDDLPQDAEKQELFLRDPLAQYNDHTEEQFQKLEQSSATGAVRKNSAPHLFFRTDSYELTYLKTFAPQWKNIKYVRLKLLRGDTDKNIDVASVGLIGYAGTSPSQMPQYRDIPNDQLPKEISQPKVKVFKYYTREFTKPCLVIVCRNNDSLLQQLCQAAPQSFIHQNPPYIERSVRRMFYVDASKANWLHQTAFAVRVGNVKFENEAYIVQQDPDTKEEITYKMDKELTLGNVQQFVLDFEQGRLTEPFTRRQETPTKDEAYNAHTNMWTLTFDTFEELVHEQQETDVVILFHASDLAEVFPTSEWEQLALLLKGTREVRVALYDLTKNNVPNSLFTLGVYLVRSNQKRRTKPIRFNQKHAQTNNFFDYIHFINENSSCLKAESKKVSLKNLPEWHQFESDTLPEPRVKFLVPSWEGDIARQFELKEKKRSSSVVDGIMEEPSVRAASDTERQFLREQLEKSYLQWGKSGRVVWVNKQMNNLMKETVPEVAKVLLSIDETLAMYSLRAIRALPTHQKKVQARLFALRHPQVERDFVIAFVSLSQGATLVAHLENSGTILDSNEFLNHVLMQLKCVECECVQSGEDGNENSEGGNEV